MLSLCLLEKSFGFMQYSSDRNKTCSLAAVRSAGDHLKSWRGPEELYVRHIHTVRNNSLLTAPLNSFIWYWVQWWGGVTLLFLSTSRLTLDVRKPWTPSVVLQKKKKRKAANLTGPEMIRQGYKGHLCITIAPPICQSFPQFPEAGRAEPVLLKLLKLCLQGIWGTDILECILGKTFRRSIPIRVFQQFKLRLRWDESYHQPLWHRSGRKSHNGGWGSLC